MQSSDCRKVSELVCLFLFIFNDLISFKNEWFYKTMTSNICDSDILRYSGEKKIILINLGMGEIVKDFIC